MEWTHWLAFNLTLLAAMASPGPAFLFALRQSMAGGFATGLATGAGLALMASTWTAAALLGLEVVFRLFPSIYIGLRIAGALYLLWLAWQLWRDATLPLADTAQPGARAFVGGIMVNLANPKSVLFSASVLIAIFPAGLTLADKSLIVINHFAVEVVVYAAFAALLATPTARAGYLRFKPICDRVAGALLGALGLRLLIGK